MQTNLCFIMCKPLKNQRRLFLDSQIAIREQLNGVNYSYCVRVASRDLHSIKPIVHTHSAASLFFLSANALQYDTVWSADGSFFS